MAELFAQKKYREHGKKGGFGFLIREKEITSLVASSVGVGDVVFLSCFVPVNVSNLRIECSGRVEVHGSC